MKFALLLLLGLTAFAQPARADYPRSVCGSIGGWEGCAADYGQGGNDLIIVKGPRGYERIRVQCKGTDYDWSSFGPNTEEYVDGIAREWCGG